MIALRPPEYFPRLAYMALVHAADRFVLADTFQYSHQSYQNRTRLRTPQGWQWISVPLGAQQHGRPIQAVTVDAEQPWRKKHWHALFYNYRSTMAFASVRPLLEPFFERRDERLGDLTAASVRLLSNLLEIQTPLVRASALDGAPDTVAGVLAAVGADTLLATPPTAPHDAPAAKSTHVLHYDHPTYHQNFDGFEPDCSALDVLMNYGREARRVLQRGASVEPYA
jgi:hypothetical protein